MAKVGESASLKNVGLWSVLCFPTLGLLSLCILALRFSREISQCLYMSSTFKFKL